MENEIIVSISCFNTHPVSLEAPVACKEVNVLCLFYRKQLELRLQPGGVDFREAVVKEVASVEERHAHREAELQEKLADSRKQYAALEDEFRMALTIEAARFSEVC